MPRQLQTWTAWLCLLAVGLTSAIVPRGSAGDSDLVLCVGCEQSALNIGAPCSPTYDCCQDDGKNEDTETFSYARMGDDGCGCMDVAFPNHILPFTVHTSGVMDLKFIAFAPAIVYSIPSDVVLPRLSRHVGAIEPPWELVPSSRAIVLLI